MKRIILLSSILLLLIGCQRSSTPRTEASFFKVVSSSFAKEFCSCLFVEKQEADYCKSYARQIVPVSSYKIDEENKTILALALGIQSTAQFRGEKLGCRLLAP